MQIHHFSFWLPYTVVHAKLPQLYFTCAACKSTTSLPDCPTHLFTPNFQMYSQPFSGCLFSFTAYNLTLHLRHTSATCSHVLATHCAQHILPKKVIPLVFPPRWSRRTSSLWSSSNISPFAAWNSKRNVATSWLQFSLVRCQSPFQLRSSFCNSQSIIATSILARWQSHSMV